MSGYIVTEELAEQMRQMKTDGMTCSQIAQAMGVSKSTGPYKGEQTQEKDAA